MEKRVTYSIDENNIALVSLTRADKRNALDMAMFKSIVKTTKQLQKNKHIRAVVVTGDGEDFCSGLDIKSVLTNKLNGLKLLFKWLPGQANIAQQVSVNWRQIPVPVIFVIHGRCWGGGLQIALGGDFRIAHPDSSWSIMEAKWGLIPDMGGSVSFKELMSKDKLLELAYTGKTFTGEEAKNYGLVSHLSDQPLETAYQLALELSQSSPDAIAANKKLINGLWHTSYWRNLAKESFYQIRVLLSPNQRIAVKRAKLEGNNKPKFLFRRFK